MDSEIRLSFWFSIFGLRLLPWQHLISDRQIYSSFWPKLAAVEAAWPKG